MERVGGRLAYRGKLISMREDVFRRDSGMHVDRQYVVSADASVMVAHDGRSVMLIRQPREAVGESRLLELPAGKIDVGEEPLDAAKRELIEETGRRADEWRHLKSFYATPGFATEELHLFLATGLHTVDPDPDDEEDIELVQWPLADLGGAIEQCHDNKSLVGLLMLREILRNG